MSISRKVNQVWRMFGMNRVALPVLLVTLVAGAAIAQQVQQAQQSAYAREAPLLFEALELRPGMSVGEIGAGRGEMTVEMAKRLGPTGKVFSTELDPARLTDIRNAIAQEQLGNVTVITGGERATNLPAGCCDAVFMRDVYHHITQPADIAKSIADALKPGGRLAIVDFEPTPGSELPAGVPADRGGHGVRPASIVAEMTAAGLTHVRTNLGWSALRADRSLFLVLFRK
jgi:predicted methyltransferase